MPKANSSSDQPNHSSSWDESDFGLPGDELTPPPFSLQSPSEIAEADPALRDTFITDTAKRELETTQDLFRFLPKEDLNALDSIGHPVKDSFMEPLGNCNLHQKNLELMVEMWEKQDPGKDLENLAQIVAIGLLSSRGTLQSLPEAIAEAAWETDAVPAYAETGHWGRGFAALTWEENYFKMGEELGLDLIAHPRLALLPEIAASIMATGLFVSGFAQTGTLARYFRGERPPGPQAVRQALHKQAGRLLEALSQAPAPNSQTELVQRLWQGLDAAQRSKAEQADAAFLLTVLGYAASTPELDQTESLRSIHQAESFQVKGQLQPGESPFWPDLARFQTDFNRAHPLPVPLNEQGLLDKATFLALQAGGFQLRAGKWMVDFAFSGSLSAVSPLEKAFRDHSVQAIDAHQWARRVYECMPVESPARFIQLLSQQPETAGRKMAMALLQHLTGPKQMALVNRPILEKVKALLEASSLLSEVQEAISGAFGGSENAQGPKENLERFLQAEPQPPMRYAVVGAQENWESVVDTFAEEGLSPEELADLNGLSFQAQLKAGQLLALPLRIRKAFWNPGT